MEQIVAFVRKVHDIMAEISVAGQRQADGIEQTGRAIDDMDQMTQQNSALVEEASATAESLAEQTEQLSGALAQFKLAAGQVLGVPGGKARLALRALSAGSWPQDLTRTGYGYLVMPVITR